MGLSNTDEIFLILAAFPAGLLSLKDFKQEILILPPLCTVLPIQML
jgi:hypothetical protein